MMTAQPATKIPLTQDKYQQLQADFERLTNERGEVMKRLKDAREQGDLSENGAYKYAKFELGSIGRQLRQIKYLLSQGEVVPSVASDVVQFGSTVTLTDGHQEVTYLMVSQHESNPTEGKLSMESPLGSLLMNQPVGTSVTLNLPAGAKIYTIRDLR